METSPQRGEDKSAFALKPNDEETSPQRGEDSTPIVPVMDNMETSPQRGEDIPLTSIML